MMFEYRMDAISAQTSATETLNHYRDLILTLRRWIHDLYSVSYLVPLAICR